MATLHIHIIIYAEPSLRPHEAHVVLSVYHPSSRKHYIYQAVEDVATESEMKFEREETEKNAQSSTAPHQEVPVPSSGVPLLPESKFDQLDALLQTTPVPRPKPATWNCQSWLRQALQNMESAGLVPTGTASDCCDRMMAEVNANTTPA
ncbi:hypothetical protein DV735_g5346, partial [Chaetothyriales sp. CBS 134920]